MAVVRGEGPGACSIVVGEEGFRGADLRSVEECLGGFEERRGGNVVRCFEGGKVGGGWAKRVMQSTPSFAAPSGGMRSFGFPGRPAVRVMEVGGVSFGPLRGR